MRRISIFLISIFAFLGCTSNYPLKPVDYNELFTDGNSKVWVIDKMVAGKKNIAPNQLNGKDVFIFHESNSVDYLPLKAIGNKAPQKGRFYLDSEKKTLSITFGNKKWVFTLTVLEEDRIVMKPRVEGSAPFSLELVPLPEL